jgi:hypothetical protein
MTVKHALRPDLPPPPARMAHLPISERGYPIPWFVPVVGGKADPRLASDTKKREAINAGRCWVCGQLREGNEPPVFVIGPMCLVNRVSAEPPSHPECAAYSVIACPFLSKPHMVRREHNLPAGTQDPPGLMIARNPGVVVTYAASRFQIFGGHGQELFRLGDPVALAFWREGRTATRAEILEAITSGIPLLAEACDSTPGNTREDLDREVQRALQWLPTEGGAL